MAAPCATSLIHVEICGYATGFKVEKTDAPPVQLRSIASSPPSLLSLSGILEVLFEDRYINSIVPGVHSTYKDRLLIIVEFII